MTAVPPPVPPTRAVVCEPDPACADQHINRWHCVRGWALDDKPKVPGVCHLRVCVASNPKEPTDA